MSHEYIVKRLEKICNSLNQLRFRKILSDVYLEHITATIHSVFMPGYHGKFWRRKVPRLLVHCTPTASSIPTRFDSRQKHLPLSSAKVIRMSASRLLVIAFLCVSPWGQSEQLRKSGCFAVLFEKALWKSRYTASIHLDADEFFQAGNSWNVCKALEYWGVFQKLQAETCLW